MLSASAAVAFAPSVHAAPTEGEDGSREGARMSAEAAFVEARALMREGRYTEACPLLERGFRLDPATGTRLNLAECMSRIGRTASAWLYYREAAAMAREARQAERETFARSRARELEGRLCRLVVHAPADAHVERDGQPVAPAALGLAIPVDPGEHVVRATFPGKTPFSTRLNVAAPPDGGSCADTVVRIPVLLTSERGAVPNATQPDRTQRYAAVTSGGLGLVAIGIATGFSLDALGKKRRADDACVPAGCTPDGLALSSDAGRSADVATVAFVTGSVAVVVAGVLWLTSK